MKPETFTERTRSRHQTKDGLFIFLCKAVIQGCASGKVFLVTVATRPLCIRSLLHGDNYSFSIPSTLSSCLFLSLSPPPPSLESGISRPILIRTAITLGEGSRSTISRKGISPSRSRFPCECVHRRTHRESGWPKRYCSNTIVITNFLILFSFYSDIFKYNFDSSYQVLLGSYDTKDSHINLRNDTPMKQAWDWSVLGMEIKGALEQQCYASPLT